MKTSLVPLAFVLAAAACGPEEAPPPACGDAVCSTGETHEVCCRDCGCPAGLACSAETGKCASTPRCGDGRCHEGESSASCCQDCGCPQGQLCGESGCAPGVATPVCGNRECEENETPTNCCGDCGCPYGHSCTAAGCVRDGAGPACGNGRCETGESRATCCDDCPCAAGESCTAEGCKPGAGGSVCGNRRCERDETQADCCTDCGCPGGGTCTDNACGSTPGGPGGLAPGSACALDADCGPARECLDYLVGGYCIVPDCTTSADCPSGSVCRDLDYGSGCLAGCTTDADCERAAEGYVCELGACWSWNYVPVNPGAAPVGASCVDASDCESDLCIPATYGGRPTGWSGGYCSFACRTDVAASCPSGAACTYLVDEDVEACLATCDAANPCRTGYTCTAGVCEPDRGSAPGGSGAPGAACVRDSDCAGPGAVCWTTMPGGYCAIPDCWSDMDCPLGSFCLDMGLGETACVEGPCWRSRDCSRRAEGYYCDFDQSCWG